MVFDDARTTVSIESISVDSIIFAARDVHSCRHKQHIRQFRHDLQFDFDLVERGIVKVAIC